MNRLAGLGALATALALCAAASPPSRLDINRLYSLPWVIGTSPQDFIWAADSHAVAFLWNDQGEPFRDVWIASRDGLKPIRVTEMPRPEIPARPGADLLKLQQAADAEMDGESVNSEK